MKNFVQYKTPFFKALLMSSVLFSVSLCTCNENNKGIQKVLETHKQVKNSHSIRDNEIYFLSKATEISLEAVKLGELAQQSSYLSDVKDLGKRMEQAHAKYLDDLALLARKQLIILPSNVTNESQAIYNKLRQTPRRQFDKAYCDRVVSNHKEAIGVFENTLIKKEIALEIQQWSTIILAELRIHLVYAMIAQRKSEKIK